MSTHSYTRLWIHLIWETLRREPLLDFRMPMWTTSLGTLPIKKSIIGSELMPKSTRCL